MLNKESTIRGKVGLILSGFIIVCLVSLNTYQVSHQHYVGAGLVGFLISLTWTYNVKKVAFGSWVDRCMYAGGASLGTVVGMLVATILY